MGRRGPAKTPTAVLKMTGSHRAKSRDKVEPKPPTDTPESEIVLSDAEQRVFDSVCAHLRSMQLEASTDGAAVARYAKGIIRYNEVCAVTDKEGESYLTEKGDYKRRPESSIRNELENTLLKLEREFGLTPSARAGLEISDRKSNDNLERKYIG